MADSAENVLEKHQNRVLSNRDRDIFLKMLDNEDKPNSELKKLAKDYQKRVISR